MLDDDLLALSAANRFVYADVVSPGLLPVVETEGEDVAIRPTVI